jgi:hypothetical protein
VQVIVVGSLLLSSSEPSPWVSVAAVSPSQSIVDAVPPSTWESTDTLTLVSGVLWKLTLASLPSPQLASWVTLTVSEALLAW